MKIRMLLIITLLWLFIAAGSGFGQTVPAKKPSGRNAEPNYGPEVGETVPPFNLPDQNGKMQNLKSITGPNGAIILFYRSADW